MGVIWTFYTFCSKKKPEAKPSIQYFPNIKQETEKLVPKNSRVIPWFKGAVLARQSTTGQMTNPSTSKAGIFKLFASSGKYMITPRGSLWPPLIKLWNRPLVVFWLNWNSHVFHICLLILHCSVAEFVFLNCLGMTWEAIFNFCHSPRTSFLW